MTHYDVVVILPCRNVTRLAQLTIRHYLEPKYWGGYVKGADAQLRHDSPRTHGIYQRYEPQPVAAPVCTSLMKKNKMHRDHGYASNVVG